MTARPPAGAVRSDSPADLVPRSPDELIIGVVIDLPEPVATELRSARAAFGDPDGAHVHPHITLRPPQRLAASRGVQAHTHLDEVAARVAPFRLDLVGTDTFRPASPVVYIRVEGELEVLTGLQAQVCAAPLDGDLSFTFHPHVTLAHGTPEAQLDRALAAMADYRASLTVDSFVMYQKNPDGTWRRRRRMTLTGRSGIMGG